MDAKPKVRICRTFRFLICRKALRALKCMRVMMPAPQKMLRSAPALRSSVQRSPGEAAAVGGMFGVCGRSRCLVSRAEQHDGEHRMFCNEAQETKGCALLVMFYYVMGVLVRVLR